MSNRKMNPDKVEAFAVRYNMVYAHASWLFHAVADALEATTPWAVKKARIVLEKLAEEQSFTVEWDGNQPTLHGDPRWRKPEERDIRIQDLW